jgi:dihydroorotase
VDLLIRGGRVVDPAQGLDAHLDVRVAEGCIADIGHNLPLPEGAAPRVVKADGWIVAPGFIDVHVHFGEPGCEHRETIGSGLAAAAAGGFTAVAMMPDTQPVHDTPTVTEYLLRRAGVACGTRLYPVGAVTAGVQGESLAEIGGMHKAGVVALSDSPQPVGSARLMRRAMEYGCMFGLPVLSHCEDRVLAGAGVMHEGVVATVLGLPGVPAEAESTMVYRDILLAALSGAHLHVQHVSTAETVSLLRRAKDRGLRVTAETCPHYLTLTDEAVRGYDTNTKVSPPLRPAADVEAVRSGLRDGTIDAIASDHLPQHVADKEQDYLTAAPGMIGLETSVGLALRLYHDGLLSLPRLVAAYTSGPARILDLPHGTLRVGEVADITLIDADHEVEVEAASLRSRSHNTPFLGWRLRGAAMATVVGGRVIFERK